MENVNFEDDVISASVENDMEIAATEVIDNAPKSARMVSLLKVDVENNGAKVEELCLEYAQILYRCTLCSVEPAVFSCKETFTKHFKDNHHFSSKNTIICYKCSVKLKSATDYENHQIQKHVSSKLEKRFGAADIDTKDLPSLTDEDLSPTYSNSSVTDASAYAAAQQKLTNKRKSTTPMAIRQKTGEELDSFHDIIKEKLKPTLSGDCKKEDHVKKKEPNEKADNEQLKNDQQDQGNKYEPVWAEGGKKVIVKEEPLAGMTDSPLALLKSLKMAPDDLSKEMLPFPYPGPGTDYTSLKCHHPLYKLKAPCHRCGFMCSNSLEYTAHLHSLHPCTTGDGVESYKLSVLKHYMPGVVEGTSNMNISVGRFEVLEKLSNQLDHQSINQWGSCCNKAIKDLYPHTIAQRKGKDKHTFYFGVRYLGTMVKSSSASSKPLPGQPVELSPFRDLQHDTESLVNKLQEVIQWSGHMDTCVTRDTLLDIMSDVLQDGDVINWGTQCNRAIRSLFPMVFIKRKGKFKSTCYFGIELKDDFKHKATEPNFRKYNYLGDQTKSSLSPGDGQEEHQLSSLILKNDTDLFPHDTAMDVDTDVGVDIEHIHSPPLTLSNDISTGKTDSHMSHIPELQINQDNTSCSGIPQETGDPNQRFVYQIDMENSYLHPESTGEQEVITTPSQADHKVVSVQYETDKTAYLRKMKINYTRKQILKNSASKDKNNKEKELDTLKKSIILHPGPFVMARIIQRHFSGQKVSHVGVIVNAMLELEHELGMGIFYTMVHGKSKVFFKAVPDDSLIKPLNKMGVRLEDYKFLFSERDTKLNDIMHEKVKAMHPQLERLSNFYKY